MPDSKQFFKLFTEHLTDSNLKDSSEILVLCIITHLSELKGYCYISNAKLGEYTRLQTRQIQNILRSLTEKEYISIIYPSKRTRQIYINEMDYSGNDIPYFDSPFN